MDSEASRGVVEVAVVDEATVVAETLGSEEVAVAAAVGSPRLRGTVEAVEVVVDSEVDMVAGTEVELLAVAVPTVGGRLGRVPHERSGVEG